MHTRDRIYPSIALFDALLDEGFERDDAEKFMTSYYHWRASGMASKIKAVFSLPSLYKIVPKLFLLHEPEEFWSKGWFCF